MKITVTSVLLSTNSDAAVSFSAGTKDIFVVNSSKSVGPDPRGEYLDASEHLPQHGPARP
jgi:hypothetical protein